MIRHLLSCLSLRRLARTDQGLAGTYGGCALDAEIIFRLRKEEAVLIVETKGDWYRVAHKDGQTGWAHKSLFRPPQ